MMEFHSKRRNVIHLINGKWTYNSDDMPFNDDK